MIKKWDIPSTWEWTKINEIAQINPGINKSLIPDELIISFVPMEAVEAETGEIDVNYERHFKEIKTGYTPFLENDVLFAKITPCMENGKMAIVPKLKNNFGFGSTEFHVLRLHEEIIPKYLYYFLSSKFFRVFAEQNMTGAVGQRRVPKSFLENSYIPIPPRLEKKRIILSIDSYHSRLENVYSNLQTIQEKLKIFRAGVFKTAFEGRLVLSEAELARQENREYEPASVLLENILKERKKRWIEDKAEKARVTAEEKSKSLGKTWGEEDNEKTLTAERVKALQKYKEPAPPDTSELPELPEGWCWVILEQIADIKGGLAKGKKRKNNDALFEIEYLRVANVQRGYLDLSMIKKIMATEKEIKQLSLVKGDILFNEGGDRDKLGRGWIWSNKITPCIHQNHVFRARLYLEILAPEYISYYANSEGQKYFFKEGRQSVNLASLSLTNLKNLPIPLPPLFEVQRIMNEIEKINSIIHFMSENTNNLLKNCEKLKQSILKYAFEGKLVDQDPNDELAEVLLERIKSEREKTSKSKRIKNQKNSNGIKSKKTVQMDFFSTS